MSIVVISSCGEMFCLTTAQNSQYHITTYYIHITSLSKQLTFVYNFINYIF